MNLMESDASPVCIGQLTQIKIEQRSHHATLKNISNIDKVISIKKSTGCVSLAESKATDPSGEEKSSK